MAVFNLVPVGDLFDSNGNVWRKRSSRTAELAVTRTHDGDQWAVHPYEGRTISYFRKWCQVNREVTWWRAMGAM